MDLILRIRWAFWLNRIIALSHPMDWSHMLLRIRAGQRFHIPM
jgi:hypothetical protein